MRVEGGGYGGFDFHGWSGVVVGGEVCEGEFEVEEIGAAGEMEGAGTWGVAFALLEDVFDIFAGERLAGDGVIHGEGDFVRAVDVG